MTDKPNIWKRIGDIYRLLEDVISIVGMLFFGAIIMYEIFARKLGFSGVSWLQEFSQLMFIIAVFIGCSRAVERDEHMAMDVLYRLVPEKYTWVLRSAVDLMMVGIIAFLTYCAYRYTAYIYKKQITLESIAAIKRWVIWIPILISLCTMTLRYIILFLRRLIASIKKFCLKKDQLPAEGGDIKQ